MTIKKYTGATKEKAIANAKEALGDGIVIMNTKNRKPDGLLGIIKPSIWEVTVAIEEDTDGSVSLLKSAPMKNSTFTVLADEKIDFPSLGEKEPYDYVPVRRSQPMTTAPVSQPPKKEDEGKKDAIFESVREAGLDAQVKSAIKEISQLVEKAESEDKLSFKPLKIKEESPKKEEPKASEEKPKSMSTLPLVRMVYNTLIDNEVDEKYVNKIFDDMGNLLTGASSMDLLISSIYQKMVLKMGTPRPITVSGRGPLVVFFVGPTGVGKTTTIAKIASQFSLVEKKSIAFITSDTFRIAASDQLNTYANILDVPMTVIYDEENALNNAVESFKDKDLILVDTSGFSHNNEEQKITTKKLISSLDDKYKSQKYLVLSVTTKYSDLKEISDAFKDICDYDLIFTKLDETKSYGNILNLKLYTGAELSYVTNGQMVPDDIEQIDTQRIVKQMLGGKVGSGNQPS